MSVLIISENLEGKHYIQVKGTNFSIMLTISCGFKVATYKRDHSKQDSSHRAGTWYSLKLPSDVPYSEQGLDGSRGGSSNSRHLCTGFEGGRGRSSSPAVLPTALGRGDSSGISFSD